MGGRGWGGGGRDGEGEGWLEGPRDWQCAIAGRKEGSERRSGDWAGLLEFRQRRVPRGAVQAEEITRRG